MRHTIELRIRVTPYVPYHTSTTIATKATCRIDNGVFLYGTFRRLKVLLHWIGYIQCRVAPHGTAMQCIYGNVCVHMDMR